MNKIKIFGIPHAGGSAAIYNEWNNRLPVALEFEALELRGRGKRFNSPLYTEFDEAVDDLYGLIVDTAKKQDYALFGHSMGGILVYDILRKLESEHNPLPVCVFLSGSCPPHIKNTKKKNMHLLTNEQLLFELKKYGGISDEVLACEEIIDIFLPIIRADYKILENRRLANDDMPFGIDIFVLGGRDDSEVLKQELEEWKIYTTKSFQLFIYDGGHFFLSSEKEQVLKTLETTLSAYLP